MSAALQLLNVGLNHTVLGEYDCPLLIATAIQTSFGGGTNSTANSTAVAAVKNSNINNNESSVISDAKLKAIHGIEHVIDALTTSGTQTQITTGEIDTIREKKLSVSSCPPVKGRADKFCCGDAFVRYCCVPNLIDSDSNNYRTVTRDDENAAPRAPLTIGDGIDDIDNLMPEQTNATGATWSQVITSALDNVFAPVTGPSSIAVGIVQRNSQSQGIGYQSVEHKRRLGTTTTIDSDSPATTTNASGGKHEAGLISLRPHTLMRLIVISMLASMMLTLGSCYMCQKYTKRRRLILNVNHDESHLCSNSHCSHRMAEIPCQSLSRRHRISHVVADQTVQGHVNICPTSLSLDQLSQTDERNPDASGIDGQLPAMALRALRRDHHYQTRIANDESSPRANQLLHGASSAIGAVDGPVASHVIPHNDDRVYSIDCSMRCQMDNHTNTNQQHGSRLDDSQLQRCDVRNNNSSLEFGQLLTAHERFSENQISGTSAPIIIATTAASANVILKRIEQIVQEQRRQQQQQTSSSCQMGTRPCRPQLATHMASSSGTNASTSTNSEHDEANFCLLSPTSLALSSPLTSEMSDNSSTGTITSNVATSHLVLPSALHPLVGASEPPPPYSSNSVHLTCQLAASNSHQSSIISFQPDDSGCVSSCDDQPNVD